MERWVNLVRPTLTTLGPTWGVYARDHVSCFCKTGKTKYHHSSLTSCRACCSLSDLSMFSCRTSSHASVSCLSSASLSRDDDISINFSTICFLRTASLPNSCKQTASQNFYRCRNHTYNDYMIIIICHNMAKIAKKASKIHTLECMQTTFMPPMPQPTWHNFTSRCSQPNKKLKISTETFENYTKNINDGTPKPSLWVSSVSI